SILLFSLFFHFFFLLLLPPPRSTLFPYTTLFRSVLMAVLVTATMGLLARVAAIPLGLNRAELSAFLLVSMFSNGGNYGLPVVMLDRKSTRLNSSHVSISYAVFCLKKKNSI